MRKTSPAANPGQHDRHQQELEGEEDDDDVAQPLQRRLIRAAELVEPVTAPDDDETDDQDGEERPPLPFAAVGFIHPGDSPAATSRHPLPGIVTRGRG